jgi:hypothetical protein
MVGAKIGVGDDKRVIISFQNANQVTVDSSFSQDYSGVIGANWGVWNKMMDSINGLINFYRPSAGTPSAFFSTNTGEFISNSQIQIGGTSALNNASLRFFRDISVQWSNGNFYTDTKDLGYRRSAAGVLEIYNGVTNGELRDLSLRNITHTGTITNASDARLKKNIRPVSDALAKVLQLAECVKHYEFKNQNSYAKGLRTGKIAQLLIENGFEGHVKEREPLNEEEGILFGWEYSHVSYEDEEGNEINYTLIDKRGDMVLTIEDNFESYIFPAIAKLDERLSAIEKHLGI